MAEAEFETNEGCSLVKPVVALLGLCLVNHFLSLKLRDCNFFRRLAQLDPFLLTNLGRVAGLPPALRD